MLVEISKQIHTNFSNNIIQKYFKTITKMTITDIRANCKHAPWNNCNYRYV